MVDDEEAGMEGDQTQAEVAGRHALAAATTERVRIEVSGLMQGV